ncbi:hypothetical protein BJ878DRAFT_257967 [Calycina marina]|uniref:LIM zinc-binding domain-containing protein n=1 Tax=Calycina marina TaxID=1763456 RepID=A0A9P7Z7L9_9HELO|nr:hypothetical protein BJ878DRAFT_257967 [Calycina marina]
MAGYTESGFFPTVKCAQCSRDIEISQMGEHICRGGQPSPPPEEKFNFKSISYQPKTPVGSADYLKAGRAIPPRVDTSAANRPFLGQDDLTPISITSATSVSPMMPNESYRVPVGRSSLPKRSLTSPTFGVAAIEPKLSNLEQNIPTGTNGYDKADPMFARVSPKNVSGGGLLQRMNTIAPGPFGVRGRRNATDEQVAAGHLRQQSVTVSSTNLKTNTEPIRPNTSTGYVRNTVSKGSESKASLPRAPKKETYGGFGGRTAGDDPEPTFLRPEDRSQTFPSASEAIPFRRPSEATTRTPSNGPSSLRATGNDDRQRKSSIGPDRTRVAPPRGVSMYRPRGENNLYLGDPPSVPHNVNLDAEFGASNPYHTPSASHSSDSSGYSENSKASSRSSPPSSVRAESPIKTLQVSNEIDLDALTSEVEFSIADLRPQELSSASSPRMIKEPYMRKEASSVAPMITQSSQPPLSSITQGGRLSPNLPQPSALGTSLPSPKKPIRRVMGSKGNCKGCLQPITGKSISSADGRLTGRYHKECFACTTCLEPFKTSEFYVINDAPYCHWHYHKLNGSICATCNKGIEGQYLESERKKKFHPGCLTCADCDRNLRNDYFEENGRVYCERDAFRRAQMQQRGRGQQGQFLGVNNGTSRMERRTTRLMMM